MPEQRPIPERVGRTINELDIDFSRFTLVGWGVSLVALGGGGALGLAAYLATNRPGVDTRLPALAFGLTMLAATVGLFLGLRKLAVALGLPVVKPS